MPTTRAPRPTTRRSAWACCSAASEQPHPFNHHHPLVRNTMQSTLIIKDLSASLELDGKAMGAVSGGQDNQANGTSQLNAQGMAAVANVGNGSLVLGPAMIQSDNT